MAFDFPFQKPPPRTAKEVNRQLCRSPAGFSDVTSISQTSRSCVSRSMALSALALTKRSCRIANQTPSSWGGVYVTRTQEFKAWHHSKTLLIPKRYHKWQWPWYPQLQMSIIMEPHSTPQWTALSSRGHRLTGAVYTFQCAAQRLRWRTTPYTARSGKNPNSQLKGKIFAGCMSLWHPKTSYRKSGTVWNGFLTSDGHFSLRGDNHVSSHDGWKAYSCSALKNQIKCSCGQAAAGAMRPGCLCGSAWEILHRQQKGLEQCF